MSANIPVVENIMSANDQIALNNRAKLDSFRVLGVNMMASPGAGKTSLIEKTIHTLKDDFQIAVIDGDLASSIDADRAAAAGADAVQINTGGACHLDAVMVQDGMARLNLERCDVLLVENVGNLVCPSGFKLGTHFSLLIASVPEGDDKPYKYPSMYRGVDALVINKIDLLPYIDYDMDYFRKGVEILNPGLVTFPLSCKTGEGLDAWYSWLREKVANNWR